MAHKTLVNGTAYEITGGKTLVDGTAYSIKNGKTLVGGTAYEVGFVTPIGELAVGSSVFLNVNGAKTEFLVVHQGKPSSMYDDSCNGTWLLMKDCYTKMNFDSSNNDYENSDVHSYLNSTLLGLFDSNIQSAIKQIKLPYHKGIGNNGTVSSGTNGLSTKAFLLSGYEIGWTQDNTSQNLSIDGAKLDYFTEGSDESVWEEKIANYNGSAVGWWLRTPSATGSSLKWYVRSVGGSSSTGMVNMDTYGIRPALVLPSNFLI